MSIQLATEEYALALRQGQKEFRELAAAGRPTYPAVLDEILADSTVNAVLDIGTFEIPADRIIGTKSAGRITAFTASFLPLLGDETEFAKKWVNLCADHLGDIGIRDPIICYEYLGNFYVEEGNKRVSVLRYFGAPRIPSQVKRVMPKVSDDPRIKAYYEFIDFYKASRLYAVQFRNPGDYTRLLSSLGKKSGEVWSEQERRTFNAYFQYFRDAFHELDGHELSVSPEHALLVFLEVCDYADLGKLSASELKARLQKMWPNIVARSQGAPAVKTEPPAPDRSVSPTRLLTKIIGADHLNVAFVHNRTEAASPWTRGHEAGRRYVEEQLGKSITCRSYFGADTPEHGEFILRTAIAEGAEVIFTTSPLMIAPSLKISVEFPKVRILNCALHMPYSTVRTYYPRVYEAKFITGAIAGAMARNDRIGYVGTYPIHGEPAAINAFALGAQLTNPRAKIELKWSCLKGNPSRELFDSGIRVISNRDTPDENRIYTDYGTYFYNEEGKSIPLGSPVWRWGKFYEHVLQAIRSGSFDDKTNQAVNYWWGLKSGVIDVTLTDKLPEGIRYLAQIIRSGLYQGTMDPFLRRIVDQKGVVRCDGTQPLTPDELVKMDWLCDNVIGHIPTIDEVIPESRATVNLLGVFQEDLP